MKISENSRDRVEDLSDKGLPKKTSPKRVLKLGKYRGRNKKIQLETANGRFPFVAFPSMLSTRLKTNVCTHEKLLDSENPLCAYARACYVRKHIINTFRF